MKIYIDGKKTSCSNWWINKDNILTLDDTKSYNIQKWTFDSNNKLRIITLPIPIPNPIPEPQPEPSPVDPIKPFVHFTHGFLGPGDSNEFASQYADIFLQCGIKTIMMMGVNWPAHTMECNAIYNTCVSKGIGFYPQPIDLGYVKGTRGIDGWADQVIETLPGIVSLYPQMAGWFLGADLIVTNEPTTTSICGISTGDPNSPSILSKVVEAMLAIKYVPIVFDMFLGTLNQRFDLVFESFFGNISKREMLTVNYYVDSLNPYIKNDLRLYLEICKKLGMGTGTMINYSIPGTPPKFEWNRTRIMLEDLYGLCGELVTYPDHLLMFKPIANEYVKHI